MFDIVLLHRTTYFRREECYVGLPVQARSPGPALRTVNVLSLVIEVMLNVMLITESH